MSTFTLQELFAYLSPEDMRISSPTGGDTTVETIENIYKRLTLDPRGKFTKWEGEKGIKKTIESFFTGKKDNYETSLKKEDVGKYLHIIGTDSFFDFGDAKSYWGVGAAKGPKSNYSLSLITPDLAPDKLKKDDVSAHVFVSRHPGLSPSTRGTDAIDMFLNYTPPIVASQMVPYLDVEFEFAEPERLPGEDTFADYTSMPSMMRMMRFLLGTTNKFASDIDAKLASSDRFVSTKAKPKPETGKMTLYDYTGMEMFLMPQTLTNMNSLSPAEGLRLVPARPFQPFMSIEGLDITVSNAGAGMFAHKKAVLKLKLHDKSRISEFAEFIKLNGNVSVWTTYGWIAPSGRGKEDAYAQFINSNMLIRDCWTPTNTQFSFESSGVVSFTIELVSKNTRELQSLTLDMTTGNDSLKKQFQALNQVMTSIAKIKAKIEKSPRFSISVSANEVLNAASTTGILTDLKDVKNLQETINALLKSLSGSGIVDPKELEDLKAGLEKMQTKSGKTSSTSLYEVAENAVTSFVQNRFNQLYTDSEKCPDPFLANDNNTGPDGHFPPDLKRYIDAFRASSEEYQEKIKKTIIDSKSKTSKPITIQKAASVVSFGKLFINFVIPAILATKPKPCDELQVYFYNLNDECGPVSNLSIAEFPVNMVTLGYAYADALKRLRTDVLTIEQFMKLVIDTQFTDSRAIGYGMTKLYKSFDPDKPEQELNKDSASFELDMADWTVKYGGLKMPMIEMIIESGDETMNGATRDVYAYLKKGAAIINAAESQAVAEGRKIIKRIHIYDKQSNPHALLQSVIDGKEGIELGNFNVKKIQGSIDQFLAALSDKAREEITKQLEKGSDVGGELAEKTEKWGDYTQRPGGKVYSIPRDRKYFKAALMRHFPKIMIGSNGSLITNASVASKTDGLMGAINIMKAAKGDQENKASVSDTPLEDPGRLPLRTNPVNITLQTAGVPIASLYQTFFIDFDTGTSLDNVYNCSQIQHGISQGKFVTSWTFIPSSDGYGKFQAPMSFRQIYTREFKIAIDEYNKKLQEKSKKPKPATASKPK